MHDSVLDTVGSPLVRVRGPPGATVAAKLESRNPGGSAKDRPALAMVEAAEAEGELSPGDALVEPTSGNTGIGLAMVAAARGYDLTVVIPEGKSPERRQVMRAYGADIELVDGDISAARELAGRYEAEQGMIQLRQFENPANPDSHYRTTGVEVLDQIGDRTVDALVAGVGTGGTITGTARRLREQFPEMEVIAVEPAANAVLSTDESGTDGFQGMGPGFVSPNLDVDLLDAVETVALDAAEQECRRLAREEGILVGQSSAASNLAARRVAARLAPEADAGGSTVEPDRPARNLPIAGREEETGPDAERLRAHDSASVADPLVVTVFWDGGERYMSTGLFDGEDGGDGD
jgi:cysteine synthase A